MTDDEEPDISGEPKKGGGARAAAYAALATVGVALIGLVGKWVVDGTESSASAPPAPATVTTTLIVTPSPTAVSPAERVISSPEENTAAPLCTDVKGTVSRLPDGKTIVVAVREDEDSRTYFEQDVKFPGKGQWSARVNLGDIDNPIDAVGHHFAIYAVVMDTNLANYLASTNAEDGATWWSSPGWPPDTEAGDARRVVRAAAVGKC